MLAYMAIAALFAAAESAQENFDNLEMQLDTQEEIVFYEEDSEDVVLNEEDNDYQVFFEDESEVSEDLLAEQE